jgi:hypothetical protein
VFTCQNPPEVPPKGRAQGLKINKNLNNLSAERPISFVPQQAGERYAELHKKTKHDALRTQDCRVTKNMPKGPNRNLEANIKQISFRTERTFNYDLNLMKMKLKI